ncbi:hypothetical protein [Pseudomonas protegens]|uniref:hypothetical protein n=1 Tax=Pseudomonas protegens TaxID=380021 RepID=UPI001B33DC78|nr:hypothetical protein [Pseudomonas protegens]MBP5124004.1 hypothetical protein [Pseudomonas protegens]
MKAESRFDTKKSFVLNPEDVKKIWVLFQGAGLEVEATLDCADGIARKTKLMSDVLDYDNALRVEIKSLKLSGYSADLKAFSTITLGGAYSTSVSFSLVGHVDEVADMRIKLMDVVDGIKPWYDLLSRFDIFTTMAAVFMICGFYFSLLGSGKPKTNVEPSQAFYLTFVIIAVLVAIGLFVWGFSCLRRRFFPVAVFEIGQGLKRNEFAEKVRWGVVVAFVVGVAAAFAFKPFA